MSTETKEQGINPIPAEKEGRVKLGFREWVAKQDDFTTEWADKFVTSLLTSNVHEGDCTKVCCPCNLCVLERLLSEYHEYRFPEKSTSPTTHQKELSKDEIIKKWIYHTPHQPLPECVSNAMSEYAAQEVANYDAEIERLKKLLISCKVYIDELQLENYNEPNVGIFYDYELSFLAGELEKLNTNG